ncbi:MAG: hypothetical protein ABIT37_01125 [Luteolibacter sp.]
MRTTASTTVYLFFGLLGPLVAQNYETTLALATNGQESAPPSLPSAVIASDLPVVGKVQGAPDEPAAEYPAQDTVTLEPRIQRNRRVDSVVDLAVLQKPSPFRNVTARSSEIPADGVKNDLNLISAVYREPGKPEANCVSLSLSVQQRIRLDDSKLLEIVETEVKANPTCACEIVKASIQTSAADTALVLSIVETSITAAPEMMRIVSQCAIAADPHSLAGVQAILAKYDINSGDGGSAKSAKDSKDAKSAAPKDDVAAMPNPLNFPGNGPVGPTMGGPGGNPLVPSIPPLNISPPVVTDVDP